MIHPIYWGGGRHCGRLSEVGRLDVTDTHETLRSGDNGAVTPRHWFSGNGTVGRLVRWSNLFDLLPPAGLHYSARFARMRSISASRSASRCAVSIFNMDPILSACFLSDEEHPHHSGEQFALIFLSGTRIVPQSI